MLAFLVFFPMISAVISYIIGKKSKTARDYFTWVVTAVILATSISIKENDVYTLSGFCSLGITFYGQGLHKVLAIMTAFVWFITTVLSKEYFQKDKNRNRYYFFMLMTLGATMGVFLSGDLYTTFIFFEMMSFTSYVLIMHRGTGEALHAAATYLAVAVIGGLVTLMGIFMLYHMTGTLSLSELKQAVLLFENKNQIYIVGMLILFGFGAKAGMFLLHTWLVEVYPAAPAPATALLSCVLSKTGVYGILILGGIIFLHDAKWGMIMVYFGVMTMLLGGILAVFSIDLKRTLACSSLSQIGFILVGIGMQGVLGEHNALAVDGTILHLTNHTIVKLILFMSTGIIYLHTRNLNLNHIRGFGKQKPLLMAIFAMGALGVMGVPFWNGYISKTLIHESIVEEIALLAEAGKSVTQMRIIEYLFLFAGGLTVAYMTKLFVAVFIEKPVEQYQSEKEYMNIVSKILFSFCAVIPVVFGIFPKQTQEMIAQLGRGFVYGHAPAHEIHYFSWVNLKGAVISLTVGAVVYLFFIRKVLTEKDSKGQTVYLNRWPEVWNLEHQIYRPVILGILPFLGALVARTLASVTDGIIALSQVYIFNSKTVKITPKENVYFTVYQQGGKQIFKDNLSKSLLFLGAGFAFAMIYILL